MSVSYNPYNVKVGTFSTDEKNKYFITSLEIDYALKDIKKGENVAIENTQIKLSDDIQRGHKIALYDIKEGEDVIKYGFPIGYAKEDIKKGCHIHVHNLRTTLLRTIDLGGQKESVYNILFSINPSQNSSWEKIKQ